MLHHGNTFSFVLRETHSLFSTRETHSLFSTSPRNQPKHLKNNKDRRQGTIKYNIQAKQSKDQGKEEYKLPPWFNKIFKPRLIITIFRVSFLGRTGGNFDGLKSVLLSVFLNKDNHGLIF